ncbi:MAG: hypothetical protein ACREQ5_36785 [Candidatus Dormibacteria bacterium]
MPAAPWRGQPGSTTTAVSSRPFRTSQHPAIPSALVDWATRERSPGLPARRPGFVRWRASTAPCWSWYLSPSGPAFLAQTGLQL